jgi:hypothetical protein
MRGLRWICVPLAAALLAVVLSATAAAGARFSSTEVVVYPSGGAGCVAGVGCPVGSSGTGNLVVAFDEGGLKKILSVDYRLDATVSVVIACGDSSQLVAFSYTASDSLTGLLPDDKGHVIANAALQVSSGVSVCAGPLLLQQIDYTNVTVTNVTTGRVYDLDRISRSYP